MPGFHTLVAGPVTVDRELSDGDEMDLDNEVKCTVLHTPGHSKGSISLHFKSENILFTGDALPLPNDLPIYEDISTCLASINRLLQIQGVDALGLPPFAANPLVAKAFNSSLP